MNICAGVGACMCVCEVMANSRHEKIAACGGEALPERNLRAVRSAASMPPSRASALSRSCRVALPPASSVCWTAALSLARMSGTMTSLLTFSARACEAAAW